MGTSSGSEFNKHQSLMLPPHEQPRSGGIGLQSIHSFVPPDVSESPNWHEGHSNSHQVHESQSESASSRETWPTVDGLVDKKRGKEKENGFLEHSVVRHISNSDKMSLFDVANDRVDVIAERMQNLPDEYLKKLKSELRSSLDGLGGSQQREEILFLQNRVQNRSDLTEKSLTVAHRVQLELLVAIKTGIRAFLHPSISLSQASLVDIFLYKRCRNITCGNSLPVEDCSCELCSKRNGFCNLCMCTICNKFDSEFNTCRWIGCDFCSHWTHGDCAIQNGLIGMGPCVRNGVSSVEMLFRCRACNRSSGLLGWVKDVFQHCSPSWDGDVLARELDYVSRIFQGSDDPKGRRLFFLCEELMEKLKKGVAGLVPFKEIFMFFQEIEADVLSKQDTGDAGRRISPQEAFNRIADVVQEAVKKMEMVAEEKMRMVKMARLAVEACDQELKDKAREVAALKLEKQKKKVQVEELDSIVRLKQAEADMFELKANEARREAEQLQQIALAKSVTTEEDYTSRYLKKRLQEAEAEKQYLLEKIKLQESSRASHGSGGGTDPYNKIQDLLKNMYDNVTPSISKTAMDRHSLGTIP